LGITADGKRELIDFRQAFSESQAEWEGFLNDLYRRGLKGDRWQKPYPQACSCVSRDLSQLLTFLRVRLSLPAVALRTTNAIERRFREVKRRTRPMGTFSDHTSIDRILFAVFSYENYKEGSATPFLLTQNI
jgi:transposase-like protein